MKKISILLLFVSACILGFAQIPNAGFEMWTSDTQADGWNSSFSFNRTIETGYFPIPIEIEYSAAEQTTDAHSGSYAMKLVPYTTNIMMLGDITIPGICQLGGFDLSSLENGDLSDLAEFDFDFTNLMYGGAPCHETPLKVKAWLKYFSDEDTCTILVLATRRNNNIVEIVARGELKIGETVTNYTQFEVPVETLIEGAVPDSINIVFAGASSRNCSEITELFVDDVTLETAAGIYDLNNFLFSVSPNPATDKVTLKSISTEAYDACLYDMNGRLMWQGTHLHDRTDIDVSVYAKGTYVVTITQNGKVRSEKVMIQ